MLDVRDLVVRFGSVTAVDGVSLAVPDGPFGLGLVGESGSGKSTLARAVMRLVEPESGVIAFDGVAALGLRRSALRAYRSRVQIVFQDPYSTLDPRMRAGAHIAEALRTHSICSRKEESSRVARLMEEVGLSGSYARRLPHQLSGGERQRVALARALAVEPRLLILDEPTSALDVTVQAKVLALIQSLRQERRLAYLLISHNLAVVEMLCERIAVLYMGQVVEVAAATTILDDAAHPYTQALRAAVPDLDRVDREPSRLRAAEPPDPSHPPAGCRFHPRCPLAVDRCRVEMPRLRLVGDDHQAACHRAEDARAASRRPWQPPAEDSNGYPTTERTA